MSAPYVGFLNGGTDTPAQRDMRAAMRHRGSEQACWFDMSPRIRKLLVMSCTDRDDEAWRQPWDAFNAAERSAMRCFAQDMLRDVAKAQGLRA